MPPNQAQRLAYVAQKRGALICWNMPTFVDAEQADPNLSVDTFAPTGLDIDNWLDACVAADMTYAVLTVKHHDGFCLYPTAYAVTGNDPYSIAETTWYTNNGQPDIVDLFVTKCRTRGLNPCLYFSMSDTTWQTRSGETYASDAAGFTAMVQTQLTELLTNYGDITAIWLDQWKSHVGYANVPYMTIYNHIKSLQPTCLILDNNHEHPTTTGQIEVYETATDGSIPADNTRLSEEVITIRTDGRWFYNSTVDQTATALTAAASILSAVANANDNSATYLLGITPGTDGALPAAQVTRLADLAA